jgi:single-stranded-DNA-specific exonuclease
LLSRKVWNVTPRISREASEKLSPFSPLAAQLLHNRGIKDLPAAEAFLGWDERLLEDPLLLPDIEIAISRLQKALLGGELIGIFGDFDADGITGTALLAEGLENLGGKVVPYLPHRVKEGHGLSSRAVQTMHKQGATLIVTVDCGITSTVEVMEAASLGIDIIITDHHTPLPEVPAALAIVNPKLSRSAYPFPNLAGVGLAFKLVQGLSEHMGKPWDERLLQLAAIGTVTDVTPLVGENRYIVAAGLRSMNMDLKHGLKELLHLGGQADSVLDTESISFVLGPRLNAPGRLEHAMSSYNLLRASSHEEAVPLAKELDRMNRERQKLTSKALDDAAGQIDQSLPSDHLILLWNEKFTPGIVGLLASRLVDQYYLPAVVVALDGDLGRGSARSISEFNMASALEECGDLFIRFGGHPRAAGFIIQKERLPALGERLKIIARRELAHLPLQPTINIDAHVRLTSITGVNSQFFQQLAPYGEGNPAPVFITKGVKVIDAMRLGPQGKHLRLRLKHGVALWNAMAFGQGEAWQDKTDFLDVVYSVGLNQWQGQQTMRMIIHDFRVAQGPSEA